MTGKNDLVSSETRRLAEFLEDTNFSNLNEEVKKRAKITLLDTMGVAIRGSQEIEMQNFYKRLPKGEDAIILKKGFPKSNTNMVAVANAMSTCFLELDEGTRPTGHPALHVFPAAFALAQSLGKSGPEFITAFTLGYEVQYRLQKATKLRSIIHPHGNFGHVGTVVAMGKLMEWNAEQLWQGINISAGLSAATSFSPCLSGSTVRNAYPGISVLTAFTVIDLVESGFKGFDSALGETFGKILGEEFNPLLLTKDLGKNYGILNNYFKFHATCGMISPVLDAAANALNFDLNEEKYPPLVGDVLENTHEINCIKVKVANHAMRLNKPAENNKLSAKFSIPFALAAFIVYGKVDHDSFDKEIIENEEVRRLETIVVVEEDPLFTVQWPAEAVAKVTIEFIDGQVKEGSCLNPFGSATNFASDKAIYEKFSSLTKEVFSKKEIKRIWEGVLDLENQQNINRTLQF